MIITIASSDKLTLSMFADFYKTIYDQSVSLSDLTCLYSSDILTSKLEAIEKLSSTGRTVLIKYKLKVQTKEIFPLLLEKSDILLKFDIYSTEPIVIKTTGPNTDLVVDRWRSNIQNLNKN